MLDGRLLVIVYIGVGCLALLALIGGLYWFLRSRRRAREDAFELTRRVAEPTISPTWRIEQQLAEHGREIDELKTAVRLLTKRAETARAPAADARALRDATSPAVIQPRRSPAALDVPEGLIAAYRAAAEDLPAEGDRFIAQWRPRGVGKTADGEGLRLEGDPKGAFVWAFGAEPHVHLLPGYMALKTWKTHFLSAREGAARDYFAAAFDLDAGSTRFDATPATATLDGDRLAVRTRGRITGFRS